MFLNCSRYVGNGESSHRVSGLCNTNSALQNRKDHFPRKNRKFGNNLTFRRIDRVMPVNRADSSFRAMPSCTTGFTRAARVYYPRHWKKNCGRGANTVPLPACILHEQNIYRFSLSNAPSKAILLGEKLIFLTKAHASAAPNSRSIPISSHSTDNGPV